MSASGRNSDTHLGCKISMNIPTFDSLLNSDFLNNPDKLSIFHLNIQGCAHKIDELNVTFQRLNFYPVVVCLTEHWLCEINKHYLNKFSGYELAAFYGREGTSRGGSCILVKQGLQYKLEDRFCGLGAPFVFECCVITLYHAMTTSKKISVAAVYRSPSSNIDSFIDSFESLVEGLAQNRNHFLICGDFNIDILKDDRAKKLFIDVVNSVNGKLNISSPTRITGQGAGSCIDNIITVINGHQSNSAVFETGLSDHLAQLTVVFSMSVKKHSLPKTKFRAINDRNILILNYYLQQENWENVLQAPDCNSAFKHFLNTFLLLFNHACPERSKTKQNLKENSWITDGIRVSCAKKRELYVMSKTDQSLEFKAYFRKYKCILRKVIFLAKKIFNNNRIKQNRNIGKATWSVVNDELGKTKSSFNSIVLLEGGRKIENSEEVENMFNEYFSSVGGRSSQLASKDKALDYVRTFSATNHKSPSLSMLEPVTTSELLDAISTLKNSKSSGWDGVTSEVLKKSAPLIVVPLLKIINQSFAEGVYPEALKLSVVRPIYKKGSKTDMSNYRPISLLPTFSKVFETIIFRRLQIYFNSHHILTNSQFGFKKGCSTADAIHRVIQTVLSSLDVSQCVGAIYCDLSKAFDCVNHSILLGKLERYGLNGPAFSLITSYLSNRKQAVSVSNSGKFQNNWLSTTSGVPQGSILGPFLFSIYLNDLSSNIRSDTTVCYADDTTVLSTFPNIHGLEALMTQTYDELLSWFRSNGLHLNGDKTKIMLFSPVHRNIDTTFKVNTIARSETANLLGVIIDDRLKWTEHIDNLCTKISSITFAFRVLTPIVSKKTVIQVYNAYIYSRLKYAIGFWGSSSDSIRIFILQKRIIRIMCGARTRDHCKPLFQQMNILSLPGIYILEALTFLINNPELFQSNLAIHHYNTRNRGDMVYPVHRLTLLERGLHYSALRLYNALPQHLKSIESSSMFLSAVKAFLVDKCPYSVSEFLSQCTE